MDEQEVIQRLREENPRYRKLYEEHILWEKQLAQLAGKPYLTPQEEIEKRTIQKSKLAGKDEMERIRRMAKFE